MTMFRALSLGCLAACGVATGCGSAQMSGSTIEVDVAMAQGQVFAASGVQHGLVSLGAGDVLGQHIHIFDVCIAARELMGPYEGPLVPADNLVAWAPVGLPISTDIALSMVAWD